MILRECSEKTVRREVYEIEKEIGYWNADKWTRHTVNGELDAWIPHDGYGELQYSDRAKGEEKERLEQKFQNSQWSE